MKYLSDSEIELLVSRREGLSPDEQQGYREYLQHQNQTALEFKEATKDIAANGWMASTDRFRRQFCQVETHGFADSETQLEPMDLLSLHDADRKAKDAGLVLDQYIGFEAEHFVNGEAQQQHHMGTVSWSNFTVDTMGRLQLHSWIESDHDEALKIVERWNWCKENCRGEWHVIKTLSRDKYDNTETDWLLTMTDEADGARYKVRF